MSIHAVIIAGGKGERLGGVRKATLRIGGKRLIDRTAEALGAVHAPLMVATGPGGADCAWRDNALAVADLAGTTGGPLAGLAAAVAALQARGISEGLLVSVAVDTPFIPNSFVQHMRAAMGTGPAAFAAWGEDFYPPNAIWQLRALQDLPGRVASGTAPASLKALQRELGGVRVDWAAEMALNPFRNINTVADLVALQAIAMA